MKLKALFSMLKEAFAEWNKDKGPRMGAALAYYTVFSIAPLLLIAIAVAGHWFGEQAARGEILGEIEGLVGRPGAQAIEDMLRHIHTDGGGTLATVIGFVLLFFGASGVFIELQDALNTIWKVTPPPGNGLLALVRERFLSFAVVLGTGFLLLVLLIVSATLSALSEYWTPSTLPGGIGLWQLINGIVSFGFITLLFALLFKVLPQVHIAWGDVWFGAAGTALLFTLGKYLIGLYLGQSSTASAFGAAGSLVLVLVWVYYSAQILLFGAEFTRVHAQRRQQQAGAAEPAPPPQSLPLHAEVHPP
jgi:membrane protein